MLIGFPVINHIENVVPTDSLEYICENQFCDGKINKNFSIYQYVGSYFLFGPSRDRNAIEIHLGHAPNGANGRNGPRNPVCTLCDGCDLYVPKTQLDANTTFHSDHVFRSSFWTVLCGTEISVRGSYDCRF